MKVAFFDIKPFEKEYLEKNLPDEFSAVYSNKSLTPYLEVNDDFLDCEILSVFVDSNLNKKVLSQFKNLKFIVLRSTGFSHCDLLYAKENKIAVFNAPHYGDFSIAEFTFALILSLTRKIIQASCSLKEQKVDHFEFQGMELFNKTIGIIGLGAIGKRIFEIAKCLKMNALCFDIEKKEGYNCVDLDELLKKSDIISINCPLTSKTLCMIDSNKIQLMKNGVILINTARGEIIRTQDLYEALLNGKIGFLALDTVECESFLYENKDNPVNISHISEKCLKNFYITKRMLNMENVLITPHIAYNTKEAQKRILDITIENLISSTKFTNGAKNLVLI